MEQLPATVYIGDFESKVLAMAEDEWTVAHLAASERFVFIVFERTLPGIVRI